MTLYLQTEYIEVTCGPADSGGCGISFAMTREFYNQTKRTRETWYCPRGHQRIWGGQSTEQKLEAAKIRETQLRDQLTASVHDAEQIRLTLLRDRHRFSNGVCPCCNRSFENVARHIRGEHPDYDITKIEHQAAPIFKCSCGRKFDSFRGLRTHQGWNRREGWDAPNTSRYSAHLTKV